MRYFYIGTMLPTLTFDQPSEISYTDFLRLLNDNLNRKDYRQTLVIRRMYDLLNIKSLWQREPLSPYGSLDTNEIHEGLLNQVTFSGYVYNFLDRYESTEERLRHFPSLLSDFFRKEIRGTEGILRDYLKFERELRLVLTAFRARKLGRDLSVELQYENPDEDFIAQLLAQKDAKEFDPPEDYEGLKTIFEKSGNDPLMLQRSLDEYRFNFIEGLVDMADLFSMKRVLVFMLELLIVERWSAIKFYTT
jgi:hypothetical protein